LLTMELQMMVAMEDCKRAQFISGAASAGRRGSVQQDLRMALQSTANGSSTGKGSKQNAIDLPTPGELAKKLSGLQHRVTKKEEEVSRCLSPLHPPPDLCLSQFGHYQKVAFHRRSAQEESIIGVSFETSAKLDKGSAFSPPSLAP
jgi:hypothetical protein